MKNYTESDYAVNKFSQNIVYRFADSIVEVTLEDYLKSNPYKTAEDFMELKAISDENYHESDLKDTNYRKRKLSIHSFEEAAGIGVASFEDKLILEEDKRKALEAAHLLMEERNLTEVQKRRFIAHYFTGLSAREIARREGVNHTSVIRALKYAREKLKNIFENI